MNELHITFIEIGHSSVFYQLDCKSDMYNYVTKLV